MRTLRTVTVLSAVALVMVGACSSNSGSGPTAGKTAPESAFKAGPINTWDTAGYTIDPSTLPCSGKPSSETRGITDTSVKVGGLADLTSPSGSSMVGGDVGAKIRFQRANDEGGVNGRKIDFVGVRDDALDPTRNVQQAQALVQQDKVFAVAPLLTAYPNYLDTLCQAVVPFFGWATNSGFCNTAIGFGLSGCLVPAKESPIDADLGTWGMVLRTLFHGQTGKAVAAIGIDVDASRQGVKNIAHWVTAAGYKVVYQEAPIPTSGLNDATPVVNAIMSSNNGAPPDVVIAPVDFSSTLKLIEALKGAGYKGEVIDAAAYDPRITSVDTLEAAQTVLQWAPTEANSPGIRQLKADFAKYAPNEVISQTAMAGYWSADLFLAALEKTGRNLTVGSFMKTVNGGTFTHSVDGALPASIWPLNHVAAVPCASLVKLQDKKFVVTQQIACSGLIKP